MLKIIKKYKIIITIFLILLTVLTTVSFVPISSSKLIPVIKKQIYAEYGVDAHIDKLILRVGPIIKIKAPIVHLMYKDGQKFAQLNTVKIYLTWAEIMKNNPMPYSISAKSLYTRFNSDDKELLNLFNNFKGKKIVKCPNILIKDYKISYFNKENNDKYLISGPELYLNKLLNYKNSRINTKGAFWVNNKQHLTYDVVIQQNFNSINYENNFDLTTFVEQIKELDFQGDIISDLKLYLNNNKIQCTGFINIDNISVLDKTGKVPKSFLYMTFWGDKAGILSNIYADENKKVYIEGMLKNTNKPIIDLKIKTDEIALKDVFNKVKIFMDLSKSQAIKVVDGILSANFVIKGDLNKLKSNGYLKIKDAYILTKDGVEIKNIASDIDFSNNKATINNTIGYINNEPIFLKGSIEKYLDLELIMDKVELKYLIPEKFGVKSGIASLVAHISGSFDNIIHKEKVHIDNLKIENNNGQLSIDSIKFDTNKSNVAYINNLLCNNPYTDTVKLPQIKLFIDRDYIKIPETNIFMANSKIVLKTEILNYLNNNFSFSLISDGFIHSNDIKKFNLPKGSYPLRAVLSGNKLIQNIDLQVLIENPNVLNESSIINLNSKFEKNSFKFDDLSLSAFSGKFSENMKANLKNTKKIVITGNIDNLKQPVFKNFRIFIPQQINLNIIDTLLQFKGDLFINGDVNAPEFIGQIVLQNLQNSQMALNVNNTIVDFNKNNIMVNSPLIKLSDSGLGLNATINTDFTKGINIKNLNIKAKNINLKEIIHLNNKFKEKLLPLNIIDGKIYSERFIVPVYDKEISLSAFSSDISLYDNLLNVQNITAGLFNGTLGGLIKFNNADNRYNANLMLRNVSSAPVLDILSDRKDTTSGTMDADINVSGDLYSKESVLGDIKFQIKNGRMNSLGRIEHLLYAQNVISDNMLKTSLNMILKALSLKDTGLFKFMRGEFEIHNEIIGVKMLQTMGPHMALYIKGRYTPANNLGDLIVLGRLSDDIVSTLGAFGEFSMNKLMVMLTGEETDYNISPADIENLPLLPARNTKEFRSMISGDIDKPSSVIMFNWISNSQRSLKQKDVPVDNIKLPDFIEELKY